MAQDSVNGLIQVLRGIEGVDFNLNFIVKLEAFALGLVGLMRFLLPFAKHGFFLLMIRLENITECQSTDLIIFGLLEFQVLVQ